MNHYNFQKRPYRASCTQWVNNTEEILKLLPDATHHSEEAILVHWQDPVSYKCGITTMFKNWWVVIGEDGRTRLYNPERFKILYEPIDAA